MTQQQMWEDYLSKNQDSKSKKYSAWHFCDNEQDANELAKLVKTGTKTATASCLWGYAQDERLPEVGDLSVILNWDGDAVCIIQTTAINIVPYCDVKADFAYLEGEGDRSLENWRIDHKNAFTKELTLLSKEFSTEMPVICEQFKVVYTN